MLEIRHVARQLGNSSSRLSLASLSFCYIRVRLSRQEGNTACITLIAQKFHRKLIYVMTGNYGKLLVTVCSVCCD